MQSTWKRLRQVLQPRADDVRHCAADAGVDLVEDERLPRRVGRAQGLERQHDARQLAARRDPGQRLEVLAGVGRDVELRLLDAPLGPAAYRTPASVNRTSQRVRAIASSPSDRSSARAERRRRGPPPRRQRAGPCRETAAGPRRACASSRRGAFGPVLDARRSSLRNCSAFLITSSSVGPCFFFRRSSAARRSSTSCSRAGLASMSAAYERRK